MSFARAHRRRPTAHFGPLLLTTLAAGAIGVSGCAAPGDKKLGPTGEMVTQAAERHGVPSDLMLAIAEVEGGLRLRTIRKIDPDDAVPVAGVLELRHGAYDSLARGAELMGITEETLQADLSSGTEAGALVLADLAKEAAVSGDKLEAWASVIEKLSGFRDPSQRVEYRAQVFRLLRSGGTLQARNGETIELEPHEEVPADLTFTPPELEPLGTPEFAGAIWFQTSCVNKCGTTRTGKIGMIAIHDTEGGWNASVATLQNDSGKSVHYIVDHDGSRVGQFIPESYDGWHVGNSYYNNRMVGIEHVGVATDDDYPTPMYEKSAALVKDIAARNSIPLDRAHLIAHQEVPDGSGAYPQSSAPCTLSPGACISSGHFGGANHHDDPGVNWEWCQYMELVGGDAPGSGCKCNDTFPLWNCVHDLSMMNRCVNGVVEIQHCAQPCVVEPLGTEDHCVPVMPSTSSTGGAGGGGVVTSSSAQASTSGAGGSNAGGAGGGSSGEAKGSCSCRVADSSDDASLVGLLGAGLAMTVVARRRTRATVAS